MKQVYIALTVAFAALLGVIVWQVWPPPEPVYQGKPLSEWLKPPEIPFTSGPLTFQQVNERRIVGKAHDALCQAAVRQAGTNAIPTLLRLLRARDSAFKIKLVDFTCRQGIKFNYLTARVRHVEGEHGFSILGADAQSAVPALVEIVNQNLTDGLPDAENYAILALVDIGPPAKQALPSLLRWMTNTDSRVRLSAISALSKIGPAKAGLTNSP